jgi:hypothetical protein
VVKKKVKKGNERNKGRDIPIEVRIKKERTQVMTLYEVLHVEMNPIQ